MKIFADCHMHTAFSTDSDTPMDQMIERGIELGLKQMCFTDHLDADFPPSEIFGEGAFLIEDTSYKATLAEMKERYKDKIEILYGIEVGLQPHLTEQTVVPFSTDFFDFIIGSCHVVRKIDICEPVFYEGRSEKEALEEYYETQCKLAAQFDNYDVFGHLDYILRYSPYKDSTFQYSTYADYIDYILRTMIERGKGIEINTGGFKKGLKEAHPCNDTLKRYKELGGEIITVGSDAHMCQNVADYFDKAAEILKSCGFEYYTVFRNRKPEFYKIG